MFTLQDYVGPFIYCCTSTSVLVCRPRHIISYFIPACRCLTGGQLGCTHRNCYHMIVWARAKVPNHVRHGLREHCNKPLPSVERPGIEVYLIRYTWYMHVLSRHVVLF